MTSTLPLFEPKYLEEILQNMVNFMRITTPELTDWNEGSRIRSLLEAASIEDDDQYHQAVELLRLWNLANVTGADLDERLTEWGLFRLESLPARGDLVFQNGDLITSFASADGTVGDTSLTLYSTAAFPPTASAPYTIRIGEGNSTVEDLTVTVNDTATGVLTLDAGTPLLNNHKKEERVSLVTGGTITIPVGTQAKVPSFEGSLERTVSTLEQVSIAAGNFESTEAAAVMDTSGVLGNVAKNTIREFVGTAPFDGAIVYNPSPFSTGRDEESDAAFLGRARSYLQSLARCTVLALERLVVGQSFVDTSNNQVYRTLSARILEQYTPNSSEDFVSLYVWPGTFDFVTSATSTSEDLTLAAEEGQKFFQVAHKAIKRGSFVLAKKPLGALAYTTLTKGTDYFVNEATGQVEIVDPGLSKGDALRVLQYDYYTGFIAFIQDVVNGVVTDPITYPGIRAAGVKVLVLAPSRFPLSPIRLAVQVKQGYREEDVRVLVTNALTRYLEELPVGGDVIYAELIERAMSVEGMYNVQFTSPTEDILLQQDERLDLDTLDIVTS